MLFSVAAKENNEMSLDVDLMRRGIGFEERESMIFGIHSEVSLVVVRKAAKITSSAQGLQRSTQ
jgi:hypothetical protein